MKHLRYLCLLLFTFTNDVKGQENPLISFVECIDQQNGIDNLLLNGRPYAEINTNASGHPYFQTKKWKPGIVYINNNAFLASRLKYDLSTYQLIIKQERQNGTSQKVILSKLLVDSFQIDGHLFINQNLILEEKDKSNYLEQIFKDKLAFYRVQKKVFNPVYNANTPYGQYSTQRSDFYLLIDDKQHKISKKKEFLACFPAHKNQIKKYMKDNVPNWKKMTKIQLHNLLKFCNDQI